MPGFTLRLFARVGVGIGIDPVVAISVRRFMLAYCSYGDGTEIFLLHY